MELVSEAFFRSTLQTLQRFNDSIDLDLDLDLEIDLKADDFISRFKKQLKLQRLESLLKYKSLLDKQSDEFSPPSDDEAESNQWKKEEFSLPPDVEAQVSNQLKTNMKSLEHLKIPLQDIVSATDNFSQTYYIGSGGYSNVYKAELDHFDSNSSLPQGNKGELPKKRSTVAIKRILNRVDEQGKAGFLFEIELLASCKHPNIVSLLGFCEEGPESILVYEYVANGSLEDCLRDANNMNNLTWDKRIQICMDIAHGLNYLRTNMEGKRVLIHSDITSANILIDDNQKAKIIDFGLSTPLVNPKANTLYTNHIAGTKHYLDPQYMRTGVLKKESNIYSFGVIMLEIFCGRLAYDKMFTAENEKGLAAVARKLLKEGRLKELIDPKLQKDGNIFMQNRPLNQRSLRIFLRIACRCVAGNQAGRPTTEVVIKELEKALYIHINEEFAHLQMPLQLIVSTTNNFAAQNIIRQGPSGKFYRGTLLQSGEPIDLVVRRFEGMYGKEDEFWTEISILSSVKHKNLSYIVGFCIENGEKVIIYKHEVNGFLDKHLSDPILTWLRRLQICLGVARVLSHIHYDVIHCDIDSSKIFLDKEWEPKVFGFEFSTKYPQSWRHRFLISHYKSMTPKSDVYSFGVLLFELLCGRKPTIVDGGVKEELDVIIHPNLMKQMNTQSSNVLKEIAGNCFKQQLVGRPTMDQVIGVLECVLELQMKDEYLQHSTVADEGTSSNNSKMDLLKIPLSEIRLATEGFKEEYAIGSGGHGKVYKAKIHIIDIQRLSSKDGKSKDELSKVSKSVAIKRIMNRSGEQGFSTEIELLSSCHHPNIVSLLGFCTEDHEMILVYEYAFNGCLGDYLESPGDYLKRSRKINLTWGQRIRICLDIARGLNYLHTNTEGKPRIIHRDIKSDNILLDENLNAKVADFGLSKLHATNQVSTVQTSMIAGTNCYMDPEFLSTGKYKRETDIYSFGVVLFEVLSGRFAYDDIFRNENDKGLAPIVRRRFNEGTLKELIDPTITEEDDEDAITLNRGPNQASFDAFSRIAYQCLAETQAKRPTTEAIIEELQNALKLQGKTMVLSRFQLSDIKKATKNFDIACCIGLDAYGTVYKAKLFHFDRSSSLATDRKYNSKPPKRLVTVAIKRISSRKDGQGQQGFLEEIEMLSTFKHSNIVSLLGFCDDDHEMIVVYEHASNGSLEDYLRSADKMTTLTWMKRLHKCLEIARGLDHLHTKIGHQQSLIHGDIKSANILFGENWEAKIAYFGISKLHPGNEEANMLINSDRVATKVYWDPEYEKTGKLRKESDIYSFGVILFEIFCGKLAYDPIYMENDKGLAHMAHQSFKDGTIKNMIDPNLKVRTGEDDVTSHVEPNQDSLRTFLAIARQCLLEPQDQRPTMENVIKELEMALYLQKNLMRSLQMSLADIKSATENFSQENYDGSGKYWEAYKGKVALSQVDANDNDSGFTTVVAKRFKSKPSFSTELEILFRYKHENIIGLVGYCEEMDEKIIVVEYASKGSLDKHLKKASLKWMQRLKICINVASGLEFLHSGAVTQKKVVHRDIRSRNVLLSDGWKAKISNFEASTLDSSHASHDAHGSTGYRDPQYDELGFLTDKSDIYSLGVILFEILCGRLAWEEDRDDDSEFLGPTAKKCYEDGNIDKMVFEGIKKQIGEESLTAFANIACKCLEYEGDSRPTASEVVIQLKKALEFQDDSENWRPKLPKNYKQIIEMSETPDIYSTNNKKNLYKMLREGIYLQEQTEWFHLSSKGKGNLMISATKFSYENRRSLKWKSTMKSRFDTVAKLMDISKLKIQIKIETKVLSKDVNYGVYLVFKFRNPTKFSSELMYVHLKYKKGGKKLHSYFATLRDNNQDDGWMMIELHRFLNHTEDTVFEVSIEGFSRYHCGTNAIYVQGIEFLAVENEKQKENKKEIVQVPTDIGETTTRCENEFLLYEVNGKKHLLLSAKEVFYNSPESKPFHLKPSAESRFREVMELLQQQAFRVSYKIKSDRLTSFIEYACYLVFKLSENCRGLHSPVKVRDLFHEKNKETKILYFRTPTSLNKNHANWIPEQRKDGWMETMVWKLNTKNKPVEKIDIDMNLKVKTYEGNMSGLIINGLEFRPLIL